MRGVLILAVGSTNPGNSDSTNALFELLKPSGCRSTIMSCPPGLRQAADSLQLRTQVSRLNVGVL